MTALSFVRILAICAAAGPLLVAVPADACESGRCENGAQTATPQPLKLNTFRRKPVATSAIRTVKKKNGDYAKIKTVRSVKQPLAQPLVTPESISPAAAQAFASYELARVRVITPEETNSLLAQAAAATTNDAATADVDSVQIVSADEINDIDRKADSTIAVSLDALSRDLAGSRSLPASAEPNVEGSSWLQRMLVMIGSAFAAVTALVKTLFA
jgi:hypothetical protein